MLKKLKAHLPLTLLMFFVTTDAFAAVGGGNPTFVWNGLLLALSDNFVGIVAFTVSTMALVVAGLHWAFGDSDRAGRKVGVALVAVAIALGASVLVGQIIAVTGAVL